MIRWILVIAICIWAVSAFYAPDPCARAHILAAPIMGISNILDYLFHLEGSTFMLMAKNFEWAITAMVANGIQCQ
jgi:hypothetical protein